MRKAAVLALVAALACVSIVCAQSPAPATTFVVQPSLISDVTIHSDDSALVRAAKTAVAIRMREAARAVLINDAYVRNSSGRISQASGSVAALPQINDRNQTIEPTESASGYRAPAQQGQQPARQDFGRVNQAGMQPASDQGRVDAAAPRTSQNTRDIPNNQTRPYQRP